MFNGAVLFTALTIPEVIALLLVTVTTVVNVAVVVPSDKVYVSLTPDPFPEIVNL